MRYFFSLHKSAYPRDNGCPPMQRVRQTPGCVPYFLQTPDAGTGSRHRHEGQSLAVPHQKSFCRDINTYSRNLRMWNVCDSDLKSHWQSWLIFVMHITIPFGFDLGPVVMWRASRHNLESIILIIHSADKEKMALSRCVKLPDSLPLSSEWAVSGWSQACVILCRNVNSGGN